ncbi:sensor histidine kinase, partial [Streptomyces sp. URMC 123]|uniref:sensor histidine kinase n=1 Tax=Streptomyces sp. URMC 123 TaxID=3423403 RepID=UPI003F1BAD7E
RVGRQALVDVREAVSGFRRPTLAGEIAGARTALAAAGITANLPLEPDPRAVTLTPERESALAWALREAVTNVVRHSGATRCAVSLTGRATLDGPTVELVVEDNGDGPGGPRGNGLTGLAERLELADGALETGAGRRRGFRLVARVPRGTPEEGACPSGVRRDVADTP